MARPPSQKQLGYLKGLGYTGAAPETSGEASKLIDQIKAGTSPAKAEKQLLKYREKKQKDALRGTKEYLNELVKMNWQYPTCAGFRIKIPKSEQTAETEIYHRAFLPLEVAIKHTETLFEIIHHFSDDELERVPSKGKFVVAPGRVVERTKGAPVPTESAGCFGAILIVAIGGLALVVGFVILLL